MLAGAPTETQVQVCMQEGFERCHFPPKSSFYHAHLSLFFFFFPLHAWKERDARKGDLSEHLFQNTPNCIAGGF